MRLTGLNINELRELERSLRKKVRIMYINRESGIDRYRERHQEVTIKLQEVIMDAQGKWKARTREVAEIDRQLNQCYAKARYLNTLIEDLQERRRIADQDRKILEHMLDAGNSL